MVGLQQPRLVGGRYRVERLLGRGGMSEVWLAHDERLGRDVAIKFLPTATTPQEDFERETGILAALRHPNVVIVYDAGEEDGRRFIVMEYVEGESLRQLLQARGPLSPGDVARLGETLAAALAYAHAHGVLHNDVKPENILIDAEGEPRLTDFGVAEVTGATLAPERAQQIVGTLAYLAPEVLQGAPPGPDGDVYALATTLFEAVSGGLPFQASSNAAMAGMKLNGRAPGLREVLPGAPPALDQLLADALSASTRERPTAAAFASALEELSLAAAHDPASHAAMATQEDHSTQPLFRLTDADRSRGGRRRRVGILLASVGAMGLLAAGAVALFGDDGTPGAEEPGGTPSHLAVVTREPTATPTATALPTRGAIVAPPVADGGDDDEDDDKPNDNKPGEGNDGEGHDDDKDDDDKQERKPARGGGR